MVNAYDFCHIENVFDANPSGCIIKEPHLCWIPFIYMVFIFKEEEYVIANSLSQLMAHRCPKLAHQSPTMGSFEPLRPTWKFDYITQVI